MSEHITVLLHEAVDALAIKPGGVYVDGTYGRGGHSRLILSRLSQSGRLIAIDRDQTAVAVGRKMMREKSVGTGAEFEIRHAAFSQMQKILCEMGVQKVDGILLDLGMSSPQLDADRGFSLRVDGPLDMRMDVSRGITAAQWIETVSETELEKVIKEYGEERYARSIARAIIVARARQPIVTTLQLAKIVIAAVRSRERRREGQQSPATRTFQAIRIAINQELEELSLVLQQSTGLLKVGGRLVVISFHSLEDRIVKRFMRESAGVDRVPRNIPLRGTELQRFNRQQFKVIGKAIRPKQQEVTVNSRSRSAVMRVAERVLCEADTCACLN
ncbi:16S rRNA (cytosine(1402)-N(4))-methyltransferase RsmH [Nitrosomonas sp.]|uniref:16S rRNA (cytosine(1402)-N(4))-methyltransferase RsmH n=1 Tax=Nitrosomonas sp. TaxID=42353 RepID=UPI00284CFE6B|nr:16S rRNA (cytosine(1402)-N(4))-methyltransferase RsmH [Nitrosomonas sp.]MCP5243377.1 16S rRNA (cytosine(1402)-N(4))-methyltransferase RsmH [Burkholderiales bacterium]MDR4514819.1 16S rRNA (cytosine(1402)-N(4))-methyltransferase RsmH [Nitrosomonas sp.]